MKRNLVGKILGKIKIFVQDFVPIRTALRALFRRTVDIDIDFVVEYFGASTITHKRSRCGLIFL